MGDCQSAPCHPSNTCGPLGTFVVGTGPDWLAFDGANMWVASSNDTVTKLSPAGATLGTFPAGKGPLAIAFDGANMSARGRASGTAS